MATSTRIPVEELENVLRTENPAIEIPLAQIFD